MTDTCAKCGLPILPNDAKRYGYAGTAHDHSTCVQRLKDEIDRMRASLAHADNAYAKCVAVGSATATRRAAEIVRAAKVFVDPESRGGLVGAVNYKLENIAKQIEADHE